ncbi:MAG: hypothetical protein IKZ19_08855 [Clostridia bacterium]|nr:hypothetical protein [Clostridia bacterium]
MKRRMPSLALKRLFSLILAVSCVLSLLTACGSSKDSKEGERAPALLTEALSAVTTSEVSMTLDMQGSISDAGGARHTAGISSDMTISSSFDPMACSVDGYSSILVDGAMSREPLSVYILPEETNYVEYSLGDNSDEWIKRILPRSEILSLPAKTGVLTDWYFFMKNLTHTDTIVNEDETESLVYTGTVDSSILNELYANGIFGSFMKSVEWLLKDDIDCTFYVDAETNLPERIVLDFSEAFTVTDMVFSSATITVEYLDWNTGAEISIPKKYAVVAADPDEIFYSTYFAWNLFLPYVGGDAVTGSQTGAGSSFQSNWETYQMRIDGGMTSIPFAFEDLKRLGYIVNDQYADIIIEPNQYYNGVTVNKGNDKIVCTFYNDATTAQPIAECKIGAVDISASDQKDNGIQIYLPGEVTLGITEEALLSAYGDPDDTVSGFSCDTLTWRGTGELQSLTAEISPATGQLIRLCLQNIPVTGGAQNAQAE